MKIINDDIVLEDSDLLAVRKKGTTRWYVVTVNHITYLIRYSDLYFVYIEDDYELAGFSRWVNYKMDTKAVKILSRHVSNTQRLIREIKEAVDTHE